LLGSAAYPPSYNGSATLARGPQALGSKGTTRVASRALAIVGISLCFFLAADVGALSKYDGVLFATACAILQPQLGPCLLVLVISVHDAPGMATPALYLGVAGVAFGMGLDEALATRRRLRAKLPGRVTVLLVLVTALAAYGIVASWLNEWLADREQSVYRHYSIIAALMAAMPLIAWLAARRVGDSPAARRDLRMACCCALAHVVVVVAMQWQFGVFFGKSRAGALEIGGAAQLVDAGARGVSRFTGPFLTPNNLAYVPAVMLLLILWTSDRARISRRFLAGYVFVGGGLAVLGASRSMLLFFGASTAFMFWRRSKLASIALGLAALVACSDGLIGENAWVFARLDDLSFEGSTRELLWSTVVNDFGPAQWVFGAGLSHWDSLFERVYFDDRVSDPHNWVLSVVGMFGVLGLLFYAKVGATLTRVARTSTQARQAVAVSLLILFFCRDLMGVQYLLNNHPNTCLNWLLLCLLVGAAPLAVRRSNRNELKSKEANVVRTWSPSRGVASARPAAA
jgi:hypothetical protein